MDDIFFVGLKSVVFHGLHKNWMNSTAGKALPPPLSLSLLLVPVPLGALPGQCVGALVALDAGVPAHVVPPDDDVRVLAVHLLVEDDEVVLVLHRLALGGHPALALPAVDPRAHAVDHELRVGVDDELLDPGRLGRADRGDRGLDLGHVVGGARALRDRLGNVQRVRGSKVHADAGPGA